MTEFVVTVIEGAAAETAGALHVQSKGVEAWWWPGRALLRCDAARVEEMRGALTEFARWEGELRGLEEEIAGCWGELEQDRRMAFEVNNADLRVSAGLGERMGRAFARRMRFARAERWFFEAGPEVTGAGRALGEALREEAGMEARAEAVDSQNAVFEHVYEMASQRMGEFQAAHQGHVMEWVIIVLLAAELLAMVAQAIWK